MIIGEAREGKSTFCGDNVVASLVLGCSITMIDDTLLLCLDEWSGSELAPTALVSNAKPRNTYIFVIFEQKYNNNNIGHNSNKK